MEEGLGTSDLFCGYSNVALRLEEMKQKKELVIPQTRCELFCFIPPRLEKFEVKYIENGLSATECSQSNTSKFVKINHVM